MKEKERIDTKVSEINNQIATLRDAYMGNLANIHRIERQISDIKPEIIAIMKRQLDYYYAIMAEGKDTRGQGLSWTIKTIWYLKGDVEPKDLPKCLDNDSINYLLSVSNLDVEKSALLNRLKDVINKRHVKTGVSFSLL